MESLFDLKTASFKEKEDIGLEYQLTRKIGAGAYSTVWDAIEVSTGKRVAVKKETGVFEDLIDGKRLLREIKLLRHLSHSNVVKLLKVLISPSTTFDKFDTIYLVLEIAESSLEKVMRSNILLQPRQVKRIMYNVLVGLQYVHSAGVLHRDLKPGNILINKDCSVRICDFGLARSIVDLSSLKQRHISPKVAEKYLPLSDDDIEEEEEEDEKSGPTTLPSRKSIIKQRVSIGAAITEDPSCPFSTPEPKTESEKFEPSPYNRQDFSRRLTAHVVTRWYRAPEIVLMQENYGPSIDIWAIGCVFAELLSIVKGSTMERKPLFPGTSCLALSPFKPSGGRPSILSVSSTDQLCVIMKVLGIPTEEDLDFIKDKEVVEFCRQLPVQPEEKPLDQLFGHADHDAIDLLKRMLRFNPNQRATLNDCLNHPYFTEVRNKESEVKSTHKVTFEFEKAPGLTEKELRELFVDELMLYYGK